jgi:hypothetical protein
MFEIYSFYYGWELVTTLSCTIVSIFLVLSVIILKTEKNANKVINISVFDWQLDRLLILIVLVFYLSFDVRKISSLLQNYSLNDMCETKFYRKVHNYKYRVSQNYRAPSEILKTIKLSPTKEGFITDLMLYPWTHSSSLSCAILIWSWSISINE